jgi:hypothetical protein
MKEIKVLIVDTSDTDDIFPSVTPWWFKDKCLLIGCLKNKDMKCTNAEETPCQYELPIPIGCRFKLLKD